MFEKNKQSFGDKVAKKVGSAAEKIIGFCPLATEILEEMFNEEVKTNTALVERPKTPTIDKSKTQQNTKC